MNNEVDEATTKVGRELKALIAAALVLAQHAAQRRADRLDSAASSAWSGHAELERRVAAARSAGVAFAGEPAHATSEFVSDWAKAKANATAEPGAAADLDRAMKRRGVEPAEIEAAAAQLDAEIRAEAMVREAWTPAVADAVRSDREFGRLAGELARLEQEGHSPAPMLARISGDDLTGQDPKGRDIRHPAALAVWHLTAMAKDDLSQGRVRAALDTARSLDTGAGIAEDSAEREREEGAHALSRGDESAAAAHAERARKSDSKASDLRSERDEVLSQAEEITHAATAEPVQGSYQEGAEAPKLAGKAHAPVSARSRSRKVARPRGATRSQPRTRDNGRDR